MQTALLRSPAAAACSSRRPALGRQSHSGRVSTTRLFAEGDGSQSRVTREYREDDDQIVVPQQKNADGSIYVDDAAVRAAVSLVGLRAASNPLRSGQALRYGRRDWGTAPACSVSHPSCFSPPPPKNNNTKGRAPQGQHVQGDEAAPAQGVRRLWRR